MCRVLLVQVRELRKVIAKDAALAPNPYLKVTLSGCSVAEKWRGVDGKQTKQSQAYGEVLVCHFLFSVEFNEFNERVGGLNSREIESF
jgi:hypothetical protein